MKFTCDKKKLVECLANLQRSVSVKSNIVALEGIHISVKKDKVTLETFNMEYGVKTQIPVKDSENGQTVVGARIFFDISKKMPDGEICVKSEDINYNSKPTSEIMITSQNCEFLIPTMNYDDFPKLPTVDLEEPLLLSAPMLSSLIKQTIFAVSDDNNNLIHTGVLIELKDKILKFVAVDGFRLALRMEKVDLENEFKIIVPGKTLLEISKLICEDVSDVRLFISDRYIFFKLGEYEVISRLLEGDFIDYNTVIPKESFLTAKINVRRLIEGVERVSLVVNTQLKSPVVAQIDENYLMLNCKTSVGKSTDGFDIKASGEPIEIAFNNKYMLEALKNADADEIILEFSSSFKPIKILPTNGDSFLFIILPVRIRDID